MSIEPYRGTDLQTAALPRRGPGARARLTPPEQPYPIHVTPVYVNQVYVAPLKDTAVAYLFWLLLGGFGAHHFYLGRTGIGVAYLTAWLVGFLTWWFGPGLIIGAVLVLCLLVDAFLLPGYTRGTNLRLLGHHRF